MTPDVLLGLPFHLLAKQDPALTGLAWMGVLGPEQIIPAAEKFYAEGYHLEDVSGLDAAEGFVVAYTFDHMEKQGRISLRVILPHAAPEAPSISGIFPGALWHEREAHDFYGIRFSGHPGLTPLLLPADMKLRPLLKEEGKRSGVRALFGGERLGHIVSKAAGYDLFDEPQPESTPKEQGGADV